MSVGVFSGLGRMKLLSYHIIKNSGRTTITPFENVTNKVTSVMEFSRSRYKVSVVKSLLWFMRQALLDTLLNSS